MSLVGYVQEHQEQVKQAVDYTAASVGVGAFLQWVPFLVAVPTAVWTCIRIYLLIEQRWFPHKKKK